ncbi:TPA: helix-turn-helix domain-containing protein [Pasteurella multocida]|nr:helix-turn-helix domain-containing protein [Pasteurella multocida]
MTPIEKAIQAVGSQAKLAQAVGKTSQFIYRMKRAGGKISTQDISADKWKEVTGLPKSELFPEFQD